MKQIFFFEFNLGEKATSWCLSLFVRLGEVMGVIPADKMVSAYDQDPLTRIALDLSALFDGWIGFHLNLVEDRIQISHQDGNPENVAHFLQAVLKHCDFKQTLTFSYARVDTETPGVTGGGTIHVSQYGFQLFGSLSDFEACQLEASNTQCPKCKQIFSEDEGHDIDSISEHKQCTECLGTCPYCEDCSCCGEETPKTELETIDNDRLCPSCVQNSVVLINAAS